MSDTWYVVFNPYPRGKKPMVRHESLEEAKAEAMRVCDRERCKVHVLQLIGTAYPPEQPKAFWQNRSGNGRNVTVKSKGIGGDHIVDANKKEADYE